MNDLSFDFEWVDPEGARGPELRATWARLSLRVEGAAVTRVFDKRSRSVRESIYLPLYPLAEWIATNWWPLVYEVRSPQPLAHNGYRSRHFLSEASEGFALPALCFESFGETMRLAWSGAKLERAPLEFLSEGKAFLGSEKVRDRLRELVEAVLGRLEDERVEETLLHQEWRAIQDLDPDEAGFCRLAGILGLDPFQLPREKAEALLDAAEQLPEVIQEEFFSAAEPAMLLQEAAAVKAALETVEGSHQSLEPLKRLRRKLSPLVELSGGPPWEQGYAGARALRSSLKLDGSPLPSFEALGDVFGIPGKELEQGLQRVHSLHRVDGVVVVDGEERPGFCLRAAEDETRRFGFCRGLFEYLIASNSDPKLMTRGGTHQQQRNRAFAAEFLLPAAALRERFDRDVVSYQEADEVAEEFGVSWAVVSHQLNNHRIADIAAD